MPFVKITPSVELPISLDEARIQCQIDEDITDEDALLESFISAATDYCESHAGRALITQEWQFLGLFSSSVELKANLLSVESIKYRSTEGAGFILDPSAYYVDIAAPIGRVCLLAPPPQVQANHPQPVTISFTCGYGSAADVPEGIKQCVRLLVGHWFRNRELNGAMSGDLAETARSLLAPYRLVTI